MFNAFGNEVAIWRAPVAFSSRTGRNVLTSLAARVRSFDPIGARVGSQAWHDLPIPGVQQAPLGGVAPPTGVRYVLLTPIAPPDASHKLSWPLLRCRVVLPAVPPLIAPPRREPLLALPAIRSDLGPALAQLVRRRMVPATRLSAEAADHWLRRLADARRMSKSRLQLTGLFRDVQLAEGGEVHHQAAHDTVTFPLSPVAVPPSTIVLARRVDSGELVVGRFY